MQARTLAVLTSRMLLFALVQTALFVVLQTIQPSTEWANTAGWWPFVAAVVNLLTVAILWWAMKQEGKPLSAVYHFVRHRGWWRDAMLALLAMAGAGILAVGPNLLVGNWLFGDAMIPYNMMFQPIPQWAALFALIVFPITIALAEMPTYFGYGMPHVEAETANRWLGVLIPSLFLAAQHMTLPLLFDWRFALWRGLMFLPLALYVGIVLHWRLRLLPYVAVLHGLLDFQAAWMVYQLSTGT
jgi:hypothetical protein